MRGTGKTHMEGAELVRMRDRGVVRGRGVTYCAALDSQGSTAGSDCYLKETEDELSTCQVPEGQGELGGDRRHRMGRDARTNTAQLYTLMELELPQLLRPNQVVEGRL